MVLTRVWPGGISPGWRRRLSCSLIASTVKAGSAYDSEAIADKATQQKMNPLIFMICPVPFCSSPRQCLINIIKYEVCSKFCQLTELEGVGVDTGVFDLKESIVDETWVRFS